MSPQPCIVWTRIARYACMVLLYGLTIAVSACTDDEVEQPTGPSSGVLREAAKTYRDSVNRARRDTTDVSDDTTAAVLRTPIMYCSFMERVYDRETRDTFTITGHSFVNMAPFQVWLVRVDGPMAETLKYFDNDQEKYRFWYNDNMISTMRWIPKGRYRALIVDARTHKVLQNVKPDLVVRSLQLQPLVKTTYDAGDRISLQTVFPWGYTNAYKYPNYPKPRLTAWLGDRQLYFAPSTGESSPGVDPIFYVELIASVVGTGRLSLRDSSINEEAFGPVITINDVPYTKYFEKATFEWDHAVAWTKTSVIGVDTSVTTYWERDTISSIVSRGCCDNITRGDTTKLTDQIRPNDRWQCVVVVDAARTRCRSIQLTYRRSSSYHSTGYSDGSSESVHLSLVDVPAVELTDGSWLIELDATTFATHVSKADLLMTSYVYTPGGPGHTTSTEGVIRPQDSMRFKLLLHAK